MVLVRTNEAVKHAYQEACVGSDGICVYDRSSLVVESFKGVCLYWDGDEFVASVKNGSNASGGSFGCLVEWA